MNLLMSFNCFLVGQYPPAANKEILLPLYFMMMIVTDGGLVYLPRFSFGRPAISAITPLRDFVPFAYSKN